MLSLGLSRSASFAALAIATLVITSGPAATAKAASSNNLLVVGEARWLGDVVRLTQKDEDNFDALSGAAWLNHQIRVVDGFDATFDIRIRPARAPEDEFIWGDGMAFVIQRSSRGTRALGGGGSSLGYGGPLERPMHREGIANSLAVEFDLYRTDEDLFPGGPDPDSNHISVQSQGTAHNSANHLYSLASTSDIPNLGDGAIRNGNGQLRPGHPYGQPQ